MFDQEILDTIADASVAGVPTSYAGPGVSLVPSGEVPAETKVSHQDVASMNVVPSHVADNLAQLHPATQVIDGDPDAVELPAILDAAARSLYLLAGGAPEKYAAFATDISVVLAVHTPYGKVEDVAVEDNAEDVA